MAVKTKHTFPNPVGTNGQSATVFAGHGIELNNLNDLDVYVTLSGGTRVLQLHQSTGSTAIGSGSGKHPQVNNTDGLYFPAVSAGTTLYNYQLTNANDTITFNSALPTGAVVTVERRTRDAAAAYTTFAGGSTIRHTDLNRSATESNYTAQEARNKVFEIEGKIFGDAAKDSSFITSADIVDGTIVSADLATNAVHTANIDNDAVTGDKLNNTGVSAGSYTVSAITVDAQGRLTAASNGTIGADNIAGDAINGDKIADDSINSEHYVDGSIDAVHLATDSVTAAKIEANAVGTSELATNAVTTLKVAADAINGDKIADNSINSEHYVDGSIDRIHIGDNQINTAKLADNAVETANILDNNVTMAKLGSGALPTDITVNADNLVGSSVGTSEIATDAVNGSKIADNSIDSEHYVDGSIDTQHIANAQITVHKMANDAVSTSVLRDDAVTTAKIAGDAVTTSEIADAELKTLAGMQSGTASILAGSTALAATTAEINTICDGKSVETTISDTDAAYPTSGAVVDYVAAQIAPLGGLEVIATDAAFPNTQPAAGVVISIADAGGLVVNGSGTSTTGRTVGGSTVTINNINSQFNSTTVDNGVAMMVSSTGSGQVYNYHKATLKEADLLSLSGDINDFAERYRVAGSAPSSSLDEGDLWWDTATDKLKVYDGSSWDEVASSGDFYINTISSYSGTGGNSATFDNNAYRFVLSNPGSTAQQHIVSINGVIQKPNSGTSQPSEGFAIDGSSIIFSNAPASGSDYFILTIGTAVSIGTPSDNTVSTAKIQNLAVTGDKIATNLDLADNKKIRFGTDNDLDIYHTSGVNYIQTHSNSNLEIKHGSDVGIKSTADGAAELYWDGSQKLATTSSGVWVTGNYRGGDDVKLSLGSGEDIQIYHTSDHNYLLTPTGFPLIVEADNLILRSVDNQEYINCTVNGAVVLSHDASTRLTTTSAGVEFGGNLSTGSGNSFTINAGGTTGTAAHFIARCGSDNVIVGNPNGGTDLYYDHSLKLSTTAAGVTVTGKLNPTGNIHMPDNVGIKIGASDDLVLWHYGQSGDNKNYISTGSATLRIQSTGDDTQAQFIPDGAVELYYNDGKKFETTSTGAILTSGAANTTSVRFGNTANRGLEIKTYNSAGNNDSGVVFNAADSENSGYAATLEFDLGGVEFGRFDGNYDIFKLSSACNGITFNGDWADANRLDDYEEGSYTPTWNSNLTNHSSYNTFQYTKIGRQVTVNGLLYPSAYSGSDTVTMSLPFTAANFSSPTTQGSTVGSCMYNLIDDTPAGIVSFVQNNATTMVFYKLRVDENSQWIGLNNSHFNSAGEIYITHTYNTDL